MNHELNHADQQTLLEIAQNSLTCAARGEAQPKLDLNGLPESLRKQRATFVTLHINGRLKGCLGSLDATQELAKDVANNAYRAALYDPRFPPVNTLELPDVSLHISVLAPLERMLVTNIDDLRAKIRPGVDGILLIAGNRRGTFLPDVWEQLPKMNDFLNHLWTKAGLAAGEWPENMEVFRYSTQGF